jgi:hypothetical protein
LLEAADSSNVAGTKKEPNNKKISRKRDLIHSILEKKRCFIRLTAKGEDLNLAVANS